MSDNNDGGGAGAVVLGILGLMAFGLVGGFFIAVGHLIELYPWQAFFLVVCAAVVIGMLAYIAWKLLRWRLDQETRGASQMLHDAAKERIAQVGLPTDMQSFKSALLEALEASPMSAEVLAMPHSLTEKFIASSFLLFQSQGLSTVEPPPAGYSRVAHASYRDGLNRILVTLSENRLLDLCLEPLVNCWFAISKRLGTEDHNVGELSVSVGDLVGDPGALAHELTVAFFETRLASAGLYEGSRITLNANIGRASQRALSPSAFERGERLFASQSSGRSAEIFATYLTDTFLLGVLSQTVPFRFPLRERFNHTYIVGGSGHGKTQSLQYMICRDLEMVARKEATVIVLDSQGDLINNVAALDVFAPHQPLHGRLVLVDPTDVEYPIALNLFEVGTSRLDSYSPLQREQLLNGLLELYDFVLGSLLGAAMTPKQATLFRYMVRAMLVIPDATIHTFGELLRPGGSERHRKHFAALSPSAQAFFDTQFDSRQFAQTKEEVSWRLAAILENQTFERMFSHPRSKLNLFAEMNAGKVILIKSAKSLLKENGCEIFGRFFLAMIAQAAQERATLPESRRLPTFVYVDECHDYAANDPNVKIILEQARKQNVGLLLAHQYLGQLDQRVRDAISANTAIKLAGGVSDADAHALAREMRTSPQVLANQPRLSFATFIRNQTQSAVSVSFPLGYLERLPKMTAREAEMIRDFNRARYSVPRSDSTRAAPARPESEVLREGTAQPTTNGDTDMSDEPSSDW